jgi:hypothetical protein
VLRVSFDSKEINKILKNTVSYSYGFLNGIELDQTLFNKMLGEYTVEALKKYIDSQARMNPDALHHVYEWNSVGSPDSRLFAINSIASKRLIKFEGLFLPSTSISGTSTEPFTDKANVMENAISVVVEPKNSDVLAFEDAGQMVFTTQSIYIENPGGDQVAGSFGRVVDDFFENYFSNALLQPFIKQLSNPKEYADYFREGTKMGSYSGIKAGRKYIKSIGTDLI